MKRSVLFLTLFCFFASFVLAEPVDQQRALQIAKEFVPKSSAVKKMPKKGEATPTSNIVYTHKMPKSGRDAFYIVNVGDAFVLVSADDVAHQILGYSFDKGFPLAEDGTVQLPPHVKGFFDDLAAQMEAAIEAEPNRKADDDWAGAQKATPRRAPSNLPESVDPLLTTTWDQGQYYNSLCPEDANGPAGHVLTGCVATAMAQIINYWGEPIHGRGIHRYDSNYGSLEVNFAESNYDFGNMPDALTGESTAEQVNAVAKLMYDCGVAANMIYSATESGAFSTDARGGLINFFQFSPDLSYAQKFYYSDTEWDEMFRRNLSTGKPIYVNTSNHALVCDGYNESGYYHFNFGWSGGSDGWYLMSSVNDDGELVYESSFGAILGIVPDGTGKIIIGQSLGESLFVLEEPMEFYSSMGHNQYLSIGYTNNCQNKVSFSSLDTTRKLVVDVIKYEGQSLQFYDVQEGAQCINPSSSDIGSVYMAGSSATFDYSGYLNDKGFALYIRKDDDCQIPTITIDRDTTSILVENHNYKESDFWQIEYGLKGFIQGEGTIVNVESTSVSIDNLTKYGTYDLYARSVYDTECYSPWVKHTVVLDPYWTEIVKEQPLGYVVDSHGNIEISSAEGLAWLSILVNGLYGHQPNSFEGKTVSLVTDINLGGYRWYPMGRYLNWEWTKFSGTFDGKGHSISNIYVKEAGSNLGLFGKVYRGTIKNVIMNSGSVSSTLEPINNDPQYWLPSSVIGGLVGSLEACYEMSNCHSSVDVFGNGGAGSLCGEIISNGEGVLSMMYNCSASGGVSGRDACGGLIGMVYGDVKISNCYSTGDISITTCNFNAWEMGRGGLIGSFRNRSFIYNCFSTGIVYYDSDYNHPIGSVIGYIDQNANSEFLYGRDDINQDFGLLGRCGDGSTVYISDTVAFHHDGNTNVLLTPVIVAGVKKNDLLEALNAWVSLQNDYNLKTWTLDDNTGYPVFGNHYVPSCYNPEEVTISNATVVGDTQIRTEISWTQIGEPDHWEVLYVAAEHDKKEGVIITVESNPCVLTGIPVGHPLDFYVRAVNDNNDMSNWGSPVTYIPDKLRWTEVVTSQPEGYMEDEKGNVYVSTAEGLAWLSSLTNGLNEMDRKSFRGKQINIIKDIDLSAYRWTPIGSSWNVDFGGVDIIGNGHAITGLYCNELADYIGFIGYMINGLIQNLVLRQCDVKGENEVGTLVGRAISVNIQNCAAEGSVYGLESVGGLAGRYEGLESYLTNSCFIGNVSSRYDITKVSSGPRYNGGICGVPAESSVINCYVVTEISDEFDYSGIITSSANSPTIVSNCYYKAYETSLGITHSSCITSNNSSFSGSGTSWTLTTPPYIGDAFYTDLVDALNAWVDANNSESQYRHWVTDTENVNGGFPIFAPAYTLTYIVDGEVYKSCSLEAGATLSAIAEPTKDGYTFGGWDELPETMPNHDVEITGTFYLYGDVNTDTKVNVVDVVDIARYVVETSSENFRVKLADLNTDLTVNIADAVVLVNHIAGDQNFARAETPKSSSYDYESCDLRLIAGEENNLSLTLTGDMDFTAFQFEVDMPEGIDISAMRINSQRKDGHQLLFNKVADNRYRVAALSMSNAVFKGNDGELLNICLEGTGLLDICIHDIHFVTTNGTDVVFDNVFLNGNTTGIADVHAKEDAPVYDLQGRRYSTLQRGINIVGNKIIIVK